MQKVKVFVPNDTTVYEKGSGGVEKIVTANENAAIDWVEIRFEGGKTMLFSQIPYILETL